MNDINTMTMEQLYNKHRGLIGHIAKRYTTASFTFEDAFQAGVFGLFEAAKRFDDTKCASFSTYAVWWIRNCIRKERTAGGLIKFPYNYALVKQDPNYIMKYDPANIAEVTDDDEGRPNIFEFADDPQFDIDTEKLEIACKLLNTLNETELWIVISYYFGHQTLDTISKDFRVTRQRIDQIKKAALAKMRERCENWGVIL